MNPMRLSKVFTSCTACALVLGAVAAFGSSPARAADDESSFDQKIMQDIMEGLGFKRDGEGINYQERGPLVIPPNSRDLPPPERTDTATSNPAWPKDPDVQRRKTEAAMERNRNISDEREREQNPLRPDQLTPGGRGKKQQASRGDDGYQNPPSGFGSQLRPSELGSSGSIFGLFKNDKKEEQAKFTGEPPRNSLTEPPAGYQTPSPDQPYGLAKGTAPAKAYNDYTDRADASRTR
jgi:hypothetical protein